MERTPAQRAQSDRLPIAALLALAMTGFICIVTETIPAGLLPQISSGLMISQAAAGQMVTAYALGSLLAAIPLTIATRGWRCRHVAADRAGRCRWRRRRCCAFHERGGMEYRHCGRGRRGGHASRHLGCQVISMGARTAASCRAADHMVCAFACFHAWTTTRKNAGFWSLIECVSG